MAITDVLHVSYDESSSMNQVLDTSFIEHDAFCLFEKLMYHGKTWYEYKDDTIDTLEPTEVCTNKVITENAKLNLK